MRTALPCLSAAVLAALLLSRVDSSRLPQLATGGDALSVAFADAKATICAAMVQKADSYFHGGVEMKCGGCHGPGHSHCHDHDCERSSHEAASPGVRGGFDPWRWIDERVAAPKRHVHLDDSRAIEMLPWFWAAVRADPHNVDAWTTAAYAAGSMMKDRALALRVIGEAKAKNPDSLEVALAEARMVYDLGRGDVAEAERLLQEARATGKRLCRGDLSRLSPRDAETYCEILDYLSKIVGDRGDHAALRTLADEASATGADNISAKAISERAKR